MTYETEQREALTHLTEYQERVALADRLEGLVAKATARPWSDCEKRASPFSGKRITSNLPEEDCLAIAIAMHGKDKVGTLTYWPFTVALVPADILDKCEINSALICELVNNAEAIISALRCHKST